MISTYKTINSTIIKITDNIVNSTVVKRIDMISTYKTINLTIIKITDNIVNSTVVKRIDILIYLVHELGT